MLTERLNLENDIVNYSVIEKLLGANNANIKINEFFCSQSCGNTQIKMEETERWSYRRRNSGASTVLTV